MENYDIFINTLFTEVIDKLKTSFANRGGVQSAVKMGYLVDAADGSEYQLYRADEKKQVLIDATNKMLGREFITNFVNSPDKEHYKKVCKDALFAILLIDSKYKNTIDRWENLLEDAYMEYENLNTKSRQPSDNISVPGSTTAEGSKALNQRNEQLAIDIINASNHIDTTKRQLADKKKRMNDGVAYLDAINDLENKLSEIKLETSHTGGRRKKSRRKTKRKSKRHHKTKRKSKRHRKRKTRRY
tara:strand:- start:181 stop:912 length:732 start_codon:yes stop_codon:yes gene_type:complete